MKTFEICSKGVCADIVLENGCPEGVKRIAEVLAGDIESVTGIRPRVLSALQDNIADMSLTDNIILVRSECSEDIRGRRETYRLSISEFSQQDYYLYTFLNVSKILSVEGSDKRGTIYGLLKISELCGVMPLCWWGDIRPVHKDFIALSFAQSDAGNTAGPETSDLYISREPSIKYRGFFINDEWPAFGRWCAERYGGFTVEAYEQVFLLLLRLKGNYMWPAMWSSTFSEDGPGLANAELADTYGIIMGTSHHEPMCRAGSEWQHVYSQYSDDNSWNFATNEEAITEFWKDGFLRNKDYENIITIGMRGENDSKLMSEDATLEDNINIIKDAILAQHSIIREHHECDLTRVPRMLAIYKEVEDYYYGTRNCRGLREWKELDDVIFLLCEDNFGNLRGLPEPYDLKRHRGGFGMYYHFDYHGAPVSYEWVNCTRLAKTREQMTMAYEYGVRELWIVNVGDLKGNEYPLNYFMNLAYDYERWSGDEAAEEFQQYFIDTNFGGRITARQEYELISFIDGITKWNSIRHPEAMNPDIFHPVNYSEGKRVHSAVESIMVLGKDLHRTLRADVRDAFDSMFYYAGMASMNLILMHIEAGMNAYYADLHDIRANEYAQSVRSRIETDQHYIAAFHAMLNGKWNHMMDSAHTGFKTWNDEGWAYPEVREVKAEEERLETGSDFAATGDYAEDCDVLVLDAENFTRNVKCSGEGWRSLQHLGRLGDAIKAYPVNKTFSSTEELPYVQYDFDVASSGSYTAQFVFMARNPVVKGGPIRIRCSVNGGTPFIVSAIGNNYYTEWMCECWNEGVMTGVHTSEATISLTEGRNSIRVYPFDPNAILERIIMFPKGKVLKKSYLGPM